MKVHIIRVACNTPARLRQPWRSSIFAVRDVTVAKRDSGVTSI